MTTQDLTDAALPYLRVALREARPAVIDRIGRAAWFALWPAWAVVTGPLLPLLARVGIELAVGLTAARLLPVLQALTRLAALISDTYFPAADKALLADLAGLLTTPRGDMLPSVRDTLALPEGAVRARDEAEAEAQAGRGRDGA